MANAWFRLYSEFSTDPKVQMLSETDQRRLVMIFCLRCNDNVTLQDEEVTFLLRISNDEWASTKALFIAKGFINESNELLNWDKRQFVSDTSKNRVAAYRERKKQSSNNDVTLQKQKSNAIDTDTDTDTDIKPLVGNGVANCPHQEIIFLYAKHLPTLSQVKVWSDARAKNLKARWAENPKRQNLEWWDKFFAYVATSDFLTGRDGVWQNCDLEWLVKSANLIKVIEGKYENKENKNG
jgi:hypothetical protein